ncbi:DUF1488 family protein [Sphingomonas nostoxanthinifaciens]|uniref:DUF1488 family protein n=1 Tax=Sphingomonas nostoxanthinifaciens TaxID=2872652 RepID=UPI001CC1D721|nr:DUF1488 family protein [Sphingomonas nostoxanthinifaciens]UAK25273.1 DUF1488 family protein [Sphingomonas nostoxanthinifaciens]
MAAWSPTNIRFEAGSVRYDREARIFRFNANDGLSRVPCAISQAAFEQLTGVRVDLDNARHIFTDWEQAVFKWAARTYNQPDHPPGAAIILGLGTGTKAA